MSFFKTIWKKVLIGVGIIIALFVGIEVKRRSIIRKRTEKKRQQVRDMKNRVQTDLMDAVDARREIDGRVKANKEQVKVLEDKKIKFKINYELIKNKEKELDSTVQDIDNSISYLKNKYGA